MVLPVEQIDRAAIWSLMLSHRSIVVDRTSPTNVPIVAMLENIGLQPAPWRSHISETAAGSVAPTYGLLQSGQSAPLIITIPPEAAYLSATSLVQVYSMYRFAKHLTSPDARLERRYASGHNDGAAGASRSWWRRSRSNTIEPSGAPP